MKLRNVKQFLKQWSKNLFGDIFEVARCTKHEVVDAEMKYDLNPLDQLRCELHHARGRLRRALTLEEGFWRQKARVKWLLDGDRNSKFFHLVVVERRRWAVIHRIRKADGEWIEEEPQIGDTAVCFF